MKIYLMTDVEGVAGIINTPDRCLPLLQTAKSRKGSVAMFHSLYQNVTVRTVMEAGPDNPRNSEASIIELKDGSLLMAWQRHEKSAYGSGDQAPSVIAVARSFDKGSTWSAPRTVAEQTADSVNVYSPSLYRCSDGIVSLFFMRYRQLVPLKQRRVDYYRIDSVDEGETFGEEQRLFADVLFRPHENVVKRLQSGAALLPAESGSGGWCAPDENISVSVFRSTDDFRTWTLSESVLRLPMRGAMEPCVAQQANGRITMVMRTQLGSVFYSESLDDGFTWSKPQTTGLHAPESCSCIATVPGSDTQIVAWCNAQYDPGWTSHYGKRTPLTVALSDDGLRTFYARYDIETDPTRGFSNPVISFTSDGTCLLTYNSCQYDDRGVLSGYAHLKLASFRIGRQM